MELVKDKGAGRQQRACARHNFLRREQLEQREGGMVDDGEDWRESY